MSTQSMIEVNGTGAIFKIFREIATALDTWRRVVVSEFSKNYFMKRNACPFRGAEEITYHSPLLPTPKSFAIELFNSLLHGE